MIQIKKISILLAIFFIIGCSLTAISATDVNDNIAIEENTNYDNLEKISTATNFTTLQEEINENDEIILSNNVTMLTEEQGNFYYGMMITKTISIDGNGYTIDANGLGRIFFITHTGSLTLKNTNLINGNYLGGGAISNYGVNCFVINCSFINNNVSSNGGAIEIFGGNCTVSDCDFINNTAKNGGAIYSRDIYTGGVCSVVNCSFINNTATYFYDAYGGAIYNNGINFSVVNCSFINNTASDNGGAIFSSSNNYCINNGTNGTIIDIFYDTGETIWSYPTFTHCMICDCVFDNSLSNTSEIYLEFNYAFLRNNTFNIKENMSCIELGEGYITSPTIATVMDNKTANVTLFYRYNIKVVFTDDNGNIIGIHNDNASVLINELEYDLINNGTYSYSNFKSNEVGNYSVGVYSVFLTNLTVKNGTLEVLPNPIELILQNLTKYYNDTTKQLIATLTNNSIAMANETITFIINGKEYNRTTDENGIVRLNINLNPGIYAVKVFYNDSDVYLFDATVTVLTTINDSDLVKFYRNDSQFYATFLDSNGTALADTNVTFNINGVWYTRTTNNNGTARLNINLDSGKYILTAINPINNESKGFNITVLSTINSNDITKFYRNGTQYIANFTAINGSALANINVKFNINGVFYTKTTDNNGTAILNINLQPGKYVLTAINPITNETIGNNVTVQSVLVGEDLNKTYSEEKSYELKVIDGQGNPLVNQTVQMNIHGVVYNKTTDNVGIARLAIHLEVGDYIITTTWNGTFTSNKIIVSSFENNNEEEVLEKHSYGYLNDVIYCKDCGGDLVYSIGLGSIRIIYDNCTRVFHVPYDLGLNLGSSIEHNLCPHYNKTGVLDLYNTPILDFYSGWFVSDDAYNTFLYNAAHSLKDNSTSLENKTLNDIDWDKWILVSHGLDNLSIANDTSNNSIANDSH